MGYENPGKGQPPEKSSANLASGSKPVDPKVVKGLGKTALGGKK